MEKKISIDELFHKKLSEGKEQMNLGAWANMERMLDGKNPYTEEEKKKRGFLPFLLMLLVTTGIVTAGYLLKTNPESGTSKQAQTNNPAANTTTVHSGTPISSNTEPVANNGINNLNNTTSANSVTPISTANQAHGNTNNVNTYKVANKYTKDVAENNRPRSQNVVSQKNQQNITKGQDAVSTEKTSSNKLNKQKNSDDQIHTSDAEKQNTIAENHTAVSKQKQSGPLYEINTKTAHKRDGSIKEVIEDTIVRSVYEKTIEAPEPASASASLDYHISNPRYKQLSTEEENHALNQSGTTNTESAQTPSTASTSEIPSALSASSTVSKKQKTVAKTSYFEDLRTFATNAYNKVTNFMHFNPNIDTYTGMSMGMNASLSSSKNNFGGFHAGVTALTPVTDFLSIISEIKFFYRNNGGYTVNDKYYKTVNTDSDMVSLAHVQQNIYSYQIDSTIHTYNFKNFYSLELPVMMQLNYRSLSAYGGINFAYNFKLNVTEKNRNYVSQQLHDTVSNATPYSYPIDKPSLFVRDDFSSRFGIGYTVGASYHFSPLLYVDLRISQNLWDNMKTNQAREISNAFFKLPSIQFSLGYRFRKFTPNN